MQIRHHQPDPRLPAIVAAIKDQMRRRGHTQSQVARASGVNQGEVSRILANQRKRLTNPIRRLCKYANYYADDARQENNRSDELSQVLGKVIGDNPAAVEILTRVVQTLLPILRTYRPSPSRHTRKDT